MEMEQEDVIMSTIVDSMPCEIGTANSTAYFINTLSYIYIVVAYMLLCYVVL